MLDEEISKLIPNKQYIWVCDPVDGTIPFSHYIPTSVFSLALCKDKQPVVAVVVDPFLDRLFYTCADKPSYCNNKIITVDKDELTEGDTIFTIPYWLDDFDYNRFFAYFKKRNIIVSVVESYVYCSLLVAQDMIKCAILPPAKPWDRAASKLLMKNAGGDMR